MDIFKPIWPWLFGVIVVGLWLFCWKCGWQQWLSLWHTSDIADKAFASFLMFASLVLGFLVCAGSAGAALGVASAIGAAQPQVWHQCWKASMVSMRNADGETGSISGGIFLIAGNLNQSSTYFYYINTSDGGFRQQQWKPDNDTTIYEEDRKDGQVIQYDEKFKNPKTEWIATPGGRLKMDFHVPIGSVQKQFNLK